MFIEKFSRFFRIYDLHFKPRHKSAPDLPLLPVDGKPSVLTGLLKRISAGLASEKQPNGDLVELMSATHDAKRKALVLLFHRANPDAAEPMYRKRAKLKSGSTTVSVRSSQKAIDEEQSVSAHLIISLSPLGNGIYRSALEEIPGISMTSVKRLIAQALNDYKYKYEYKKKSEESYCVFQPVGVKSETLQDALTTGTVNYITLVRPGKSPFVDGDGLVKPLNEVLKLRVISKVKPKTMLDRLNTFAKSARKSGWADFNVEIGLPDERTRTVKIENDEEAKEVLFVKSEQADFKNALSACTTVVIDEVVVKGLLSIKRVKV